MKTSLLRHAIKATLLELLYIVVVSLMLALIILTLMGTFLAGPAHGKSPAVKYDPDVLRAHLAKFGEFEYMTSDRLRRILRAARPKPLLSEEICAIAATYSHKPFLYEIIESFGNPKVRGPRR